MTGDDATPDGSIGDDATDGLRRTEIETVHADPAAASLIARSVRPDNTDAMETESSGDVVRTTIERETTGGLASSVDDYVVNVDVAHQIITTTRQL